MSNEQQAAVESEEQRAAGEQHQEGSEPTKREESLESSDPTLLKGVTKDESGQLVLKVGTSVYKGKDQTELWDNISKGIAEKDEYFQKVKAKESIKSPFTRVGEGKPDAQAPDFSSEDEMLKHMPDEMEITKSHFEKVGLDPRMANFTDADWLQYQEDKALRDFQLMKLQDRVERTKEQAINQYREASVDFVNADTVNKATDNVQDMVAESGVDPEEFGKGYEELLQKVWSDKTNFNRYGTLIAGRIERAAHKAILKAVSAKSKTAIEKKVEEEERKSEEMKRRIKGGPGGGGGGGERKEESKARSVKEAAAEIRKKLAAGIY